MSFKNISKYNEMWSKGLVTKPIIILIGGYAGTGKSTLAKELTRYLQYINIVPTGVIRAISKTYTNKITNPELFYHTFDLHKITKKKDLIIDLYLEQCAIVNKGIAELIKFVETEKQHYIIEGNHVIPKNKYISIEAIIIELYLQVKDPSLHVKMLAGPTHQRNINSEQYETGRILHDYIVKSATAESKYIFNFEDSLSETLSFIDKELEKYL